MAHVEKSSFEEIRAACLSSGTLYEDPAFPATDESVYYSSKTRSKPIRWLRPWVRCLAVLDHLLGLLLLLPRIVVLVAAAATTAAVRIS